MHRNTKIFLSYAFMDDNPVRTRLIKDLSATKGIVLWRAEEQLKAGTSITEGISQAIEDCDYFIQFMSYSASHWVNAELEIAMARQTINQNLKIIIVNSRYEVDPTIVPDLLKRGLFFDFASDYDSAFKTSPAKRAG